MKFIEIPGRGIINLEHVVYFEFNEGLWDIGFDINFPYSENAEPHEKGTMVWCLDEKEARAFLVGIGQDPDAYLKPKK